ncbi:hypothetical protein ScPMuIL_001762 [Solemya velum]
MFSDEILETVDFKSAWRKERSVRDSEAQTDELTTNSVAVQSLKRREKAVQTASEQKELRMVEDNSPQLVNFLKSVESLMIKELEKNRRSRAFDDFSVSWEDESNAVSCIHTLCNEEFDEQLQITGLSWNSTGAVIAASYGRFDHKDWCTHRSALCTWNLDRQNINDKKPNTTMDSSSCLMCIQFHPKNPAWVAAGNFNGEVLVWNLNREDDMLMATSGIGNDAHREPVSKVHWIPDISSKAKGYNLVSVSGDGKILVWKVDPGSPTLQLLDGFVVMTQSLPRSMKVKGVRGDKEVGIISISYNCEDRELFIVGSESGAIFKCSMLTQGNPAGSHIVSSVPLKSPVTFTYSPHHGPVYSVECSPFHRNAFMSAAMDQCIRLYSILQQTPVLTVEPGEGYIFSAKWSPMCPTVFAATTESGNLLLYDLKRNQPVPVQKIQASPNRMPVFSCQFNPYRHSLLATGDGSGYINVFRLSDELRKTSSKDIDILGNLVSVSAE